VVYWSRISMRGGLAVVGGVKGLALFLVKGGFRLGAVNCIFRILGLRGLSALVGSVW